MVLERLVMDLTTETEAGSAGMGCRISCRFSKPDLQMKFFQD